MKTLEVDVKPTSSDEIEIAPRPSMAGPTPEPRKEALEVKLRAVKAVVAATPKRKSTTRREALETKLKHYVQEPAEKRKSEIYREALEVKLHHADAPAAEERQSQLESPEREGLAKLEQLKKVPEAERTRPKRNSIAEFRKRASSLMALAGGIKPSMLKQAGGGGGAGDEMKAFVTGAHDQLKAALEKQQAELARIEKEMEQDRKERKKAERKEFLEQHLKARQEETTKQEMQQQREKQQAHDREQMREVFDELLQTEATYLGDLEFVRVRYLTPMRELLPPSTHNAIFANLELLVQLHTTLSADLHPACDDAAASAGADDDDTARGHVIAAAFRKLAPFFKMYAVYSAQYAHVPEALEATRREVKGLDAFLKEAASKGRDEAAASAPAAAPAPADAEAPDGETSSQPAAAAKTSLPAATREAALEQLLFRPVQRMCLYPLLFKQALAARIRVDKWSEHTYEEKHLDAEGHVLHPKPHGHGHKHHEGPPAAEKSSTDADRTTSMSTSERQSAATPGKHGSSAEKTVRQRLEEVFDIIQQTLGHVNEDVRNLEGRFHTMQVLTSEVHGGADFITPDRVLRHECHVDMKATQEFGFVQKLCSSCSSKPSAARRRFKWYVFSDGVLICRNRQPTTDFILSHEEIKVNEPPRLQPLKGEDAEGLFEATTTEDGVSVHHHCWADGGQIAKKQLLDAVHAMQQAATTRLGAGGDPE